MSHITDPIHAALVELRSDRGRQAIADAWTRWTGLEVEVETAVVWTTYRPHHKGRIVLDLTITTAAGKPEFRQMMFVVDPPGTERQPFDWNDLPDDVFPPLQISPWNATGWTIPHVPRPSGLADLMRPTTLADILGCPTELVGEPELVRLVPMRRALIRTSVGDETIFVKSYAGERSFHRSVTGLRAAGDLPVAVPDLIAVDTERLTFIMQGLPGVELSSLVGCDDLNKALHATGTALAAVHQADAGLAGHRSGVAETTDIAQLLVADLAAIEPRLAGRIEVVADQLTREYEALEPVTTGPIHGKCFGDQILYDASTGQVSIVDWDDAKRGDPHFDLGRLIAHLGFLVATDGQPVDLAPLLDGYRKSKGRVCPRRLHWHVAAAVLLRGKISLLRPLADEWYDRLARLVDLVETLLEPDATSRDDVDALLAAVTSPKGPTR
ncbi:MAG: aminoglycoside phosphotransferase family protein [Actinomycetota bacterium]